VGGGPSSFPEDKSFLEILSSDDSVEASSLMGIHIRFGEDQLVVPGTETTGR